MALPLSLKHLLDEWLINWLVRASPEELAPQLSQAVYGLLNEGLKYIREKVVPFVNTTVLTRNFRTLLKEVFTALRSNNGIFAKWLNLDMGSGKTHLLTLLIYLICCYDSLEEHLEEYRKLGLDRDIAARTAILAVDLRVPAELPTFFKFFAESLRRIKEEEVANYIENCIKQGMLPEASTLVQKIRGAVRLLVIIDELHHAVLTYRYSDAERRRIVNFLNFVVQLMNYLRHHDKGFVILAASARRDYERVLQIEKDELVIAAENLISQLGRLEPVIETEWLSVAEAKQIILRKLNAKPGAEDRVLHRLFDRFIERIIRAESDVPQAQHLRSLIKAMAVFAKNAMEFAHPVVSPAAFSEGVIDALFPEGDAVAERYKSIYVQVMREIDMAEGVADDIKRLAKIIANTVFAMSITGRPEQLIETVKAYKVGRYTLELLPAIPESEIRSLLADLGYRDYDRIDKAFELLDKIPYVHSVKAGNAYLYFVVPIESVIAVFNRFIEERYKSYLSDRDALVDKLIGYLNALSGSVGENSYLIVANDYRDLEDSTKRLNPDVMYLIVYADRELVRHLEKSLRGVAQPDVSELIRKWFVDRGVRDISEWLSEHRRHNVAVAVPVLSEDVIKGLAKYEAIKDAIAKVVNEYLIEYEESGSRLPEVMRRIIEVELDDIHRDLGDKFVDAVRSAVNALSLALSYLYIYECKYAPESGIRCTVSLKNAKVDSNALRAPAKPSVNRDQYRRLIDLLETFKNNGARHLVYVLMDRTKKLANFVDDVSLARNVILALVLEDLKRNMTATISRDMNTYVYGSSLLYISPKIVEEAVKSITDEEVCKHLGKDVAVKRSVVGSSIVFTLQKALPIADQQSRPRMSAEQGVGPVDVVSKILEDMDRYDKGVIVLHIEFDANSKRTIRTYLNVLRQYIKGGEVRGDGQRN